MISILHKCMYVICFIWLYPCLRKAFERRVWSTYETGFEQNITVWGEKGPIYRLWQKQAKQKLE